MKQKITPIAHLLNSKANEVSVKDSALKQWVKEIFFSNANQAHSPVNLGRFGLHNAKDVVAFLRTPGGKRMENDMIAQALSAAQLQQQRLKFLLHQSLLHRLRAMLFLSFARKKSKAHTQSNVEELDVQQQILSKKLAKKSSTESNDPIYSDLIEQLDQSIKDYQEAIDLLTEQQAKSQAETARLDEQLIALDAQRRESVEKYGLLEDHLNEHNELDGLDLTPSNIKAKINDIEEFLAQNQEDHSPDKLVLRFAKNIQIESLKERLAVKNSEKYYLNSDLKPVTSFTEAAFVLNRMCYENNLYLERPEKIVKLGDEFYLLRPGQSEESIQENTEERSEAKARFDSRKLEIMPMQKRVEHQKLKEFSHINNRLEAARAELQQHQAFLVESSKHLKMLDMAINAAINSRTQILSSGNTPRPRPAGPSTAPRPSPEKQAFIHEMEELLKQKNLSPRPIFELIENKALNKSILTQYLNEKLFNEVNNRRLEQKLANNLPLTSQDKDSLLRFVRQMAAKDEKLNQVEPSSIPSPLRLRPK